MQFMKTTAAILFGSVSSEYEVSLRSAASVLRHIPRDKYDVIMIGISKSGEWFEYAGDPAMIETDEWLSNGCTVPAFISPDRKIHGMISYGEDGVKITRIDVAFPVLHGKNGEDGTIQGLFEIAEIPYVGCGVLSCAVCMDKAVTHTLLDNAGIPTAPWCAVVRGELENFDQVESKLQEKLSYPMFVKPANAGSSVGISKAGNHGELRAALDLAFEHDHKAVVEQTITGQEIECAVLGNGDPAASVLGEIVPKHEFYDYEAKYLDDSTQYYIPARIAPETASEVQRIACAAYTALECSGLARVDFFVKRDGSILLNEINTIPGFTSISMYPQLFETSGIPYSELIDRLLCLAIERQDSKKTIE